MMNETAMQSNMRLVILNDFSSAKGGASSLAIENANLMASLGIHVTFICGDQGHANGFPDRKVQCLGINGSAINPATPLKNAINGLYNPAAQQFLANWIGTHDTP